MSQYMYVQVRCHGMVNKILFFVTFSSPQRRRRRLNANLLILILIDCRMFARDHRDLGFFTTYNSNTWERNNSYDSRYCTDSKVSMPTY